MEMVTRHWIHLVTFIVHLQLVKFYNVMLRIDSIITHSLIKKKTKTKRHLGVEASSLASGCHSPHFWGTDVQSRKTAPFIPMPLGAQPRAARSLTLAHVHSHSSGSSGVCDLPTCTCPGPLVVAGAPEGVWTWVYGRWHGTDPDPSFCLVLR